MAFNRQDISTTSTFTTGGISAESTTPTFTQWENTTSAEGFEWNLGNKWTINVNAVEDQLSFSYNGMVSFRANSSGLMDIDFSIGAEGDYMSLTNLNELPSTSSYTDGTMIRSDGEMYILEEE